MGYFLGQFEGISTFWPLKMSHKVICLQKKISRIFKIRGTLIVTIHICLQSKVKQNKPCVFFLSSFWTKNLVQLSHEYFYNLQCLSLYNIYDVVLRPWALFNICLFQAVMGKLISISSGVNLRPLTYDNALQINLNNFAKWRKEYSKGCKLNNMQYNQNAQLITANSKCCIYLKLFKPFHLNF